MLPPLVGHVQLLADGQFKSIVDEFSANYRASGYFSLIHKRLFCEKLSACTNNCGMPVPSACIR